MDDGASRLAGVQRLLAEYRIDPNSASDDDLVALRRSARAAIDRLDDEPEFDVAHRTLDEVGQHIRHTRPELCFFTENGDDYTQDCPVALGHIRLGLSVAVEIEESHCSICEGDLWECPHIPGELYDGKPAVRVITKAKFFEVSVVERPDFPDARITSRPVARADVEAAFGGPLPADARPICDRCLTACPGIRESPLRTT
ncbi:hypothetical protein ABIC47_003484 [Leifsonia sp. 563]|uniref:hypothetical protein n=1 Tax=Leifsonia sp. 563 TaxID=3156412 RepID=UPI00339B33D5